MSLASQLEQPIRYPDTQSPPFMTKRARWLVVLGFLLPGTAQILTGKRTLGRIGLTATLVMLGVGALLGTLFLINRAAALTVLANQWVLFLVQIALVAYAVMWLVLGFDTLRLTRLSRAIRQWRVPIAILSILLTVVPSVGALYAASTVNGGRELLAGMFRGAPAVEPVDGRYNFLLLGTDADETREGLRPDSVSLVSVDADTGQSLIVGLPRELANVPFRENSPMAAEHPNGFGVDYGCYTGRCWLNSVYAEAELFQPELYPSATSLGSSPGIEATKDAVSGATGLDVQFYVLINMDGFEALIDALGGVDIVVEERLPIGGDANGWGVEGYLEVGPQHLNGYEALWYARSRYGSARGDYDRMDRQRELQAAILQQMTPVNVLTRFQEIARSGNALAQTDIPESMLGRFVDLAAKAKEHDPVTVQLNPPDIITEAPDYDLVREMVQQGLREASPAENE